MPPLPANNGFRIGTVEGFFGRQWSWQARRDHASFLARQQFTTYLYAPKNDAYLRKQWFDPYPPEILGELLTLATHTAALGIEFGVGLSPFELYRDFSNAKRDQLLRKLEQLNALQAPLLAVLFDDMMGELPGLADKQLAIFDCIRQHSDARHFMLCPTYYSDDPLLIKHFGQQPGHYLETLGAALPAEIDIFWTGPKVISHSYPADHLLAVGERLRRRPLLWDNYPVNDAKRLAPFLNLLPFDQRPFSSTPPVQTASGFSMEVIARTCSGVLANPMNQAYLSQLALESLARLWQQLQSTKPVHGNDSPVVQQLKQDCFMFQLQGLDSFSAETRGLLLERYQALLPDPMAAEVCEWLQNQYAFDPACLT